MDLTFAELKELEFLMDKIIKVGDLTINYFDKKGWENSNFPSEKYIKSKTKEIMIAKKIKDKIKNVKVDVQIK